jgi:hypothetical protein
MICSLHQGCRDRGICGEVGAVVAPGRGPLLDVCWESNMSHLPGSSALRRVVVAGLAVTLTGGLLAVVPAGAAGTSADTAAVTAAAPSSVVQVFSRSGRGDLITGGNALIEVVLPTGASADGLRVDVDGRDVTSAFRLGPIARRPGPPTTAPRR